MDEVEAMQKVRQRMAAYAGLPETYVPVEAARFRHLDLAFYDRTQQELQARGFTLLGDFEIAELKGRGADPRCFIRSMVSRDGTVIAACFHPKFPLWLRLLLRLMGKPVGRTVEFETEFTDDVFIANGMPPVLLLDPPPLLIRESHPAGTTVAQLLALHQAKVQHYLAAHPGVATRRVTDVAGMIRMQQRQHAMKGAYRQAVGGMSADEIRRLGGFTRERAAKLKRLMDGETPQQVEANPTSLPPFPAEAAADDARIPWWKRDLSERGIGVVLLVCGLGLGWLGFYQPWRQALEGAARLEFSFKAGVISVMVLGLGLLRVLAPVWSVRVLGPAQHPTKAGYAVAVVLALAGLGVVLWFRGYLESLGYVF